MGGVSPTWWLISVETHLGQEALIIRLRVYCSGTVVMALTYALDIE